MTDSSNLIRLIQKIRPTEIYNLAAQSHVKVSFDLPEYTAETDGIGTLRILEAIRICGLEKTCRIYQASTSELYGKVREIPQNETTAKPWCNHWVTGKLPKHANKHTRGQVGSQASKHPPPTHTTTHAATQATMHTLESKTCKIRTD